MIRQTYLPVIKESIDKAFTTIEYKINIIRQNVDQQKINKIIETLNLFGLENFKKIILKSENEKREYGFRFCKNGETKILDMCIGNSCNVDLKHCPEESKAISSFHTHPTNIKGEVNFLSDTDIYADACDKLDFSCLGTIENYIPKIKCYLPYYGLDDIKYIIDWRNEAKAEFGIKIREYNPSGTSEGKSKIPPDKYKELTNLWQNFLYEDNRLKRESTKASLKLEKEPNQGAALTINL